MTSAEDRRAAKAPYVLLPGVTVSPAEPDPVTDGIGSPKSLIRDRYTYRRLAHGVCQGDTPTCRGVTLKIQVPNGPSSSFATLSCGPEMATGRGMANEKYDNYAASCCARGAASLEPDTSTVMHMSCIIDGNDNDSDYTHLDWDYLESHAGFHVGRLFRLTMQED